MPSLAELVVNLTAETAAFTSKLDAAHKDAQKFAANIQATWSGLVHMGEALVGALAVEKFADVIKGVAEQAKQMDKLSQSYGLAIETVSGLRVASKLTGVDLEQLTVGMSRLAKNAAEVAKTGEQTGGAFKTLGVNVADGNGHLRPMNDLLLDVADKFSKLEAGTGRTALAIQVFGRSGAAMLPFLDRGKQGIQELMQLSEELGMTWTDKDLQAAKLFKEQLEVLELKSEALKEHFTQGMMPALNDIANAFVRVDSNGNSLAKDIGTWAGNAFKTLVEWIAVAAATWETWWLKLQRAVLMGGAGAEGMSPEDIQAMAAGYDAQIAAIETRLQRTVDRLRAGPSLPATTGKGGGAVPDLTGGDLAMKQLADAMDAVKNNAKAALDEGLYPLEKKASDLLFALKVIADFEAQHPGTFFPSLNAQAAELANTLVKVRDAQDQLAAGFVPGLAPSALNLPAPANIPTQMQQQLEDLGETIRKTIEAERAQEQALSAEAAAGVEYRVQLEQHLINLRQQSAETLGPMVDQYRELAGVINDPKLLANADKFNAQLQTMQVRGVTAGRELATAFRDDLGGAFIGIASQTESVSQAVSNMAASVLRDLNKMIWETMLWKAILGGLQAIPGIGDFFSGPVSGAAGSYSDLYQGPGLSSTFGIPGRAGGGDVLAGHVYMVGEHGPEPFVPGVSGTIIPNSALRSGGDTPNVQVNVVNHGSPKDAQVSQARYDRAARQFVIDVVLSDVRQNGPLRGLLGAPSGSY